MQAVDVMQPDLVTITPDDAVVHAARLMLQHRISGLPVTDGSGHLLGIVTEGDLLHRVENDTDRSPPLWQLIFASPARLAREFVKSTGRCVGDVMTREVVTVDETTPLADIAELFDRRQIKRAPVLRHGEVVGIVTRADLMRALVGFGEARAGDLRTVEFR